MKVNKVLKLLRVTRPTLTSYVKKTGELKQENYQMGTMITMKIRFLNLLEL